MLIRMIRGMTRVCGKSQGYLGLPIRDGICQDGTPYLQSAWEPTPDELRILQDGGSIIVTILGARGSLPNPPPMDVGVEWNQDLTNPYADGDHKP